MYRDIKVKITAAANGYPLKKRAAAVLLTFFMLLATDITNWQFPPPIWHLEPWRVIVLCAGSVAWLFEPWGRWNMLFLGIALGNLLLYVSR
jgi:hypothetical protein